MKVVCCLNQTSEKTTKKKGKTVKDGYGLTDYLINHVPVELHLPGYKFAGPGWVYTIVYIPLLEMI